MEKSLFRKECLERRRSLPIGAREAASRQIVSEILNSKLYLESDTILAYAALPEELSVDGAVADALLRGKRVYLPRVNGKTTMEFVRIHTLNEVQDGVFGVREPVGDEIFHGSSALVLLPMVGVDRSGHRIGHGKGYYDRYFGSYKGDFIFFGICYDFQQTDEDLGETHDLKADQVLIGRTDGRSGT